MRLAHTVAQVREAEASRLAELPEGALMQTAAHGLAVAVADFLGGAYGARVLAVVGAGDNGGDALFALAFLARRGARVEAVLLDSSRAHQAGLAAFRRAGGSVVSPDAASRPDVLLDGIVGIGAAGGLRPDAVAALAPFAGVPVVALDVPSGVDVDSGEVPGECVRADLTVTFGTRKPAHLVDPAASRCGAVHLVDLGLSLSTASVSALGAGDVSALVPVPTASAQKYSRGVVGLRTGSAAYPGAAVLGTAGALGFAGMVRYAGGAADAVRAAHPEVVVGDGRVQAWVVGSGGGSDAGSMLAASLDDGVPVVVDADGLTHVTSPLPVPAVLTPHAGELARMLSVPRETVEAAPLHHVRAAAARFECVVLLKGRRTLVSLPSGEVRVNTTGVPWLATAGAGDVLAGLIGSLLAAGLSPFDAASVGAWLHGAAAARASRASGGPITAGDVATWLRRGAWDGWGAWEHGGHDPR